MKLTRLAGALAATALLVSGCSLTTHHTTRPRPPHRPHHGRRPRPRPDRPGPALAHQPRRAGPGHPQPRRRHPRLRPGHRKPGHHGRQPPGLRSRRPHRRHPGPHHPGPPRPAPHQRPRRLRHHAQRLHHPRRTCSSPAPTTAPPPRTTPPGTPPSAPPTSPSPNTPAPASGRPRFRPQSGTGAPRTRSMGPQVPAGIHVLSSSRGQPAAPGDASRLLRRRPPAADASPWCRPASTSSPGCRRRAAYACRLAAFSPRDALRRHLVRCVLALPGLPANVSRTQRHAGTTSLAPGPSQTSGGARCPRRRKS